MRVSTRCERHARRHGLHVGVEPVMFIIMNDWMSALRALEQPMPSVIVATTRNNGIVIDVGEWFDLHWWARFHFDRLGYLDERLGSGDGERKASMTRQTAFEPLPASVLFCLEWPFDSLCWELVIGDLILVTVSNANLYPCRDVEAEQLAEVFGIVANVLIHLTLVVEVRHPMGNLLPASLKNC